MLQLIKIARPLFILLLSALAPYSIALSQLPADTSAPSSTTNNNLPPPIIGVARYVVDGDSLYLAGEKRQIRLWGVDAPERDEAGYDAARLSLQALALKKRLQCFAQDIDRYGRVVARCWPVVTQSADKPDARPDKTQEINWLMIKSGTASEYCFFTDGYYGFCE